MKIFFFSFLIFWGSIWAQEVSKPEELEVIVGIDKTLRLEFKPSTKVQIGNKSILAVDLVPDDSIREITFRGTKSGQTSVIVRNTSGKIMKNYRVSVVSNDLSKTVLKLREFFKSIEGIFVGIRGGIVTVEGNIIVPSDIGRIAVVLSREEFSNVVALVELSPQTQRLIASKMQEEIQKNGMKDVTVRVVNRQFWLEGFVTRENDRALANRIARAFLPDQLENLSITTGAVAKDLGRPQVQDFISENIKPPPEPPPKLVKILAQFVELTKDYGRIFGFKWQPTLEGGGGTVRFGRTNDGGVDTNSSGAFDGIISNLFPKLSSAKSSGHARIIQSGMVIVENPSNPSREETAKINKTTTIPFNLGSGEFTRAQSTTAGFDLTVKPLILADNNIRLGIGLNVNFVTGSPPQTLKNSVSTKLVVKSGDTAVMGGVAVSEKTKDFNKDPPGGQDQFGDGVTPLFNFLRSKSMTNNRSQYVMFITPEIIESASKDTAEIKKKFRARRR